MKKLSKLLLGLILSFMVIQVPLALSNAVYADYSQGTAPSIA